MSAAAVGDPPTEATDTLLRAAADPDVRARLHALLGPFCHECRNHLNTLRLSLYLAGRNGPPTAAAPWRDQELRYREVEQAFERLHQICRPLSLAVVRLPIALLWDEATPHWADQCARAGITLETRAATTPIIGDFDPHHLRRGLDALIDWRIAVGSPDRTATFSWAAEAQHFWVEWAESGPATPLDECADDSLGSLALPFLARVLAAHGGTLHVETRNGYRVVLRWPLEIPVHE